MNDTEITALAREYAEWVTKDYGKENAYIPGETATASIFLRWLTRRFFLVEKSVVEFEYNEVKEYLEKDRYLDMYDEYEAKRGLLEYLFPELGKEVEE